jgi:hypothetical protein
MLRWRFRAPAISFNEMRRMDDAAIDTKLQNLNRRGGSIEQILPTLATKED